MSQPSGIYPTNNEYRPQPPFVDQSRGRHPANHRYTTGATYGNGAPIQISFPQPSLPNSLLPGGRPRAISSHGPQIPFYQARSGPPPIPPYPPTLSYSQFQSPPPMGAPPIPPAPPAFSFLQPQSPTPRVRVLSNRSQSVPAPPALPPKQFDVPTVPPLPPKIPLYPDFIPHAHPSPSLQPPSQSPPKSTTQPRCSLPAPTSSPIQSPVQSSQPGLSQPSPARPHPQPLQYVSSPPNPPSPMPSNEEDELERVLALSAKESRQERSKQAELEDEDLARAVRESLLSTERPYLNLCVATVDVNTKIASPFSNSTNFVASDVGDMPSFPATPLSISPSVIRPWDVPPLETGSPYQSRMDSTFSQMADDEALARRLAAEDEAPRKTELPTPESEPQPPLYHQVVAKELTAPDASSDMSSRPGSSIGRRTSASTVGPASVTSSPSEPPHSFITTSPTSTRRMSTDTSPHRSTTSLILPPRDEDRDGSTSEQASIPTPNQFVDKALLNGVSFGFNAPQISFVLTMLRGPIPNIISLPNGKCPPFHIHAPTWRQLLKLMARLSGTRIEASLEAMAATKTELKLRTVVQFVRVHRESDWRTVLYLTIDSSPPANTSASNWKYTNGDVNTLPWSYTQVHLPALLHDGADTTFSKFYTIPSTAATPYPSLPINFPNMAMYLASAMEDSRRAMHDGSSGMRKLAKMVDSLYPAEAAPGMEDPEQARGGVSRVIRNMFGRGSKQNSRRNEDTWDLVTPFVPDDY